MQPQNKPEFINRFLGTVAGEAVNRGGRLTKIRLVKYLYLFDLFWAQSKGQTFTGWEWAFVHYGPYCRESTDAIDKAVALGFLSADAYESKYGDKDFQLYSPGNRLTERETESLINSIPIYVSSRLFSTIKKWYDDTYGLLDYVYFHTGPMVHAQPGAVLSFDGETELNFQQFRPVEMLPLSKKKKSALQEVFQKMKAEQPNVNEPAALYDAEYFNFIKAMNGEETATDISGEARVEFPQYPEG